MQQKPHMQPSNDLSDVLKEWRVETSMPPRFREGVWRRIAHAEERSSHRSDLWHSLLLHWDGLVRRPIGIAACLSLFTAVGIGFGLWHAETFTAQAETAWQNAYFHSVSPTTVILRE